MEHQSYKVARKVQETPDTVSIFLASAGDDPLAPFKAGQHLAFDIPEIGERKYVLSSFSSRPGIYRITVAHDTGKTSGHGSFYWTHKVSSGDIVRASGPAGAFHLPDRLERPIVVLSSDIGEAAVAAIAEELAVRAPAHRAIFLHGTLNSATFALKGKLTSIRADLPNASWHVWFSAPLHADREGKDYEKTGEMNADAIGELLPAEPFDALICGPEKFVEAISSKLKDHSLNCKTILSERMGDDIKFTVQDDEDEELPPLKPCAVNFLRSNKQATWTPDQGTLLEFAENIGIDAPFSCRTGMCGACAQKIPTGGVVKIRKTSAKVKEPYQLLCSNIPVSDLEIDL